MSGKKHILLDPDCECAKCLLKRQVRKVVPFEEMIGYKWAKSKLGKQGLKDLGKRHRKKHR